MSSIAAQLTTGEAGRSKLYIGRKKIQVLALFIRVIGYQNTCRWVAFTPNQQTGTAFFHPGETRQKSGHRATTHSRLFRAGREGPEIKYPLAGCPSRSSEERPRSLSHEGASLFNPKTRNPPSITLSKPSFGLRQRSKSNLGLEQQILLILEE